MNFDAKSPSSFGPAFKALREDSDEITKELLKEADQNNVNIYSFFSEINQQQIELTNSQKPIHEGVQKVENNWLATNTIEDRNKSYISAIDYFKQTESAISRTSKQIDKIIKNISEMK